MDPFQFCTPPFLRSVSALGQDVGLVHKLMGLTDVSSPSRLRQPISYTSNTSTDRWFPAIPWPHYPISETEEQPKHLRTERGGPLVRREPLPDQAGGVPSFKLSHVSSPSTESGQPLLWGELRSIQCSLNTCSSSGTRTNRSGPSRSPPNERFEAHAR